MAQKIIVLGSHECATCAELKSLIDKSGEVVEYLDLDTEEGIAATKDMIARGLKLEDADIPKCIIDFGDRFGFCNEEEMYNRLKNKLSAANRS